MARKCGAMSTACAMSIAIHVGFQKGGLETPGPLHSPKDDFLWLLPIVSRGKQAPMKRS